MSTPEFLQVVADSVQAIAVAAGWVSMVYTMKALSGG